MGKGYTIWNPPPMDQWTKLPEVKDFTPAEIAEIKEATKEEKMVCAFDVLPKDSIYCLHCPCPKCSPRW